MLQALRDFRDSFVRGETLKEELLRDYREYTQFTRDLAYLQQRKWWFVFVVDELKSDQRDYLKVAEHADGPMWSYGYTVDKLRMWKKNLGGASFPIPLASRLSDQAHGWFENESDPQSKIEGELFLKNRTPSARIRGELHLVTPDGIAELDKAKQNRVQFERKRLRIIVPYREVVWTKERRDDKAQSCINLSPPRHRVVDAWGYIGVDEYWTKEIDNQFTPVRTYLPKLQWLGRYYDFTQQELKDF